MRTLKKITFLLLLICGVALQLEAKVSINPKANPEAVVLSGNMRFTVLTPEIIRIEWSDSKRFEDRASFIVINRNLPVPHYETSKKDGYLYIKTDKFELRYKEGAYPITTPASTENLSIAFDLNGTKTYWYPGKKDPLNLKGTNRTLDHSDGDNLRDQLEDGLLSRSGWKLIDETQPNGDTSKSLMFENQGGSFDWVAQPMDDHFIDWYFMGYGHDYKKALSDFTKISGKMPMPPMYSFGYWYSKYQRYTSQDIKDIVTEVQENDIPMDIMVIDMDWHYANQEGDNGRGGWTGWSWNTNLIPDPQELISWIHGRKLKTTLNLHPADGVKTDEDAHKQLAHDLGLPENEDIKWNIENQKFYKEFFKNVLRPKEDIGVDFWWLDWQQWPIAPNVKDLSNTFWLNHVFFNDMKVNYPNKRPMIFHRWGGLGNHRYPIGFSGDTWANFPTLAYQVYFNSTASNVAYGYWSHDLGGHNQAGENNPELYLRWLQFGVFSPMVRSHATNFPQIDRRIWKYPNFNSMRETIELRYAMMPYIYTYAREAYDTGVSICRPLYYDSPEENAAYKDETTYMFGDNILVSPIVTPSNLKSGVVTKTFWMPEGNWIEGETGAVLKGKQHQTRSFAQNEIPFFYREGSIMPMYPAVKNLQEKPDTLIIKYLPGQAGEFSYYEDNGDNDKYQDGAYTTTKLTQESSVSKGTYTIFPSEGVYKGMPSARHYELRILSKLPAKTVKVNGEVYAYSTIAKEGSWTYDGESLAIVINIPLTSCKEKVEANVWFNAKQAKASSLISGKMGVMRRVAQFADSMEVRMGNIPNSLINLASTSERITRNPKNTLKELQSLEDKIGKVFEELMDLDNCPTEEANEWQSFILGKDNTSKHEVYQPIKNDVVALNPDRTPLWITGTAIPGGTAVLTENPSHEVGEFCYNGEFLTGEFKIMNTPKQGLETKYYVPFYEDENAIGEHNVRLTSDKNHEGWKVVVADDSYKIRLNTLEQKLSGEILNSRNELYIIGGATAAGWSAGDAIKFRKDINNPNVYIFEGILKTAKSGEFRNGFKLLEQKDWNPTRYNAGSERQLVSESKYIHKNEPGDYKWVIDPKKEGMYRIVVDMLQETISVEYLDK